MKITVLQGQSLLDIAVQSAGSVEAAFETALQNGINLLENMEPGHEVNAVQAVNKNITSYYQNNNIKPATYQPDGIEYTGIEYDFIIE